MPDWQKYLGEGRRQLARVPIIGWVAAGVIGLSFGVALYLETGAPPYVALYEGLSPADGGTVIAQLQKLGIPYELEAAGDVILVPQSQLAAARLQLGAAQIPGTTATNGWDKVENAPITASDLAQTTMADQALEASLAQSINSLSGVSSAQVFLAMPQDTPFLADQPKPTASVIIAADDVDAMADGPAIASLVAGAVPGLQAQQVTVTTTRGTKVFPTGSQLTIGSQFAEISAIENLAVARVTTLLLPLVGVGHSASAPQPISTSRMSRSTRSITGLISWSRIRTALSRFRQATRPQPSAFQARSRTNRLRRPRPRHPQPSLPQRAARQAPPAPRPHRRPRPRHRSAAAAPPTRPMSPTRAKATSRSPTGRLERLQFPLFWTRPPCGA